MLSSINGVNMKRLLLLMILFLPCALFSQIKKADATLLGNTSSVRDKLFSDLTLQFIRFSPEAQLYFGKTICTGEKFYVADGTDWYYHAIQDGHYGYWWSQRPMPEGYYTVNNIYITEASFENSPYYDTIIKSNDSKHLIGTLPTINTVLRQFEGENPPFTPHKVIYEVKPDEGTDIYFFDKILGLPLASYEYHKKELLGKDVWLLIDDWGEYKELFPRVKSINDDITGDYVPITTSKYKCVDIAVGKRFGESYPNTEIVAILENNGNRFALNIKELNAFDYGLVYKTHYQDIVILSDDSYKKAQLREEQLRIATRNAAIKAMQERDNYLISKFGESFGRIIADGKVSIGMSEEMVLEAWGYPETRFRHIDANQTVTVWYYGITTQIKFVDGKITSISQVY